MPQTPNPPGGEGLQVLGADDDWRVSSFSPLSAFEEGQTEARRFELRVIRWDDPLAAEALLRKARTTKAIALRA